MNKKMKDMLKKSAFLNSFKSLNKKIFLAIIFDVLFYISLVIIVLGAIASINTNAGKMQEIMPILQKSLPTIMQGDMPRDVSLEQIKEVNAIIKSLKDNINMIVWTAAILVGILSILFRSLIWSKVLKVKFSKKYFKRYFVLNAFWTVSWLLVFLLSFDIFKTDIFMWILSIGLLIYLYFSSILRSLYNDKERLRDIVKKTFAIGLKKVHLVLAQYIPTIIFSVLLGLLIWDLWYRFSIGVFLIIVFMILIVYFAWLRVFVFTLTKEIEPKLEKKH
jgi:hypothetical protein